MDRQMSRDRRRYLGELTDRVDSNRGPGPVMESLESRVLLSGGSPAQGITFNQAWYGPTQWTLVDWDIGSLWTVPNGTPATPLAGSGFPVTPGPGALPDATHASGWEDGWGVFQVKTISMGKITGVNTIIENPDVVDPLLWQQGVTDGRELVGVFYGLGDLAITTDASGKQTIESAGLHFRLYDQAFGTFVTDGGATPGSANRTATLGGTGYTGVGPDSSDGTAVLWMQAQTTPGFLGSGVLGANVTEFVSSFNPSAVPPNAAGFADFFVAVDPTVGQGGAWYGLGDFFQGTAGPADMRFHITTKANNPTNAVGGFDWTVTTTDDVDGVMVPEPVTIGDFVWNDLNGNGIQDTGEPGINGVAVTVTYAGPDGIFGNGDDTSTTLTTATVGGVDGQYSYTGAPGNYQVSVGTPSGYSPTATGQGTTATDSNPSPTSLTLTSGRTDDTIDFGFYKALPGIELVKDADKTIVAPGGQVTYFYSAYNTGSIPLSITGLTDDNGTPSYTADDFTPTFVGGDTHNLGQLDPDETWTYTATTIPPVTECAPINNVDTKVGTLITQVLAGGDIKVTYIQEQNVNDNRYGTGATAATGWPRNHNFSDLVGSDKAQFVFTDGNGATVLDFQVDYISATTKAIFPSGTVLYPSGYGTLGVSGGDGKMLVGSAANVLSATTSLTENLKQLQFVSGFLVNSPPETAPNSNTSIPAGWDYYDSYTVIVSKAAFGTKGFGGVTLVGLHDSPPKQAPNNLITPEPCDSDVTNTATVTATAGTVTLTASAQATVMVRQPFVPGNVVAGPLQFSGKKVSVTITNNGTAAVDISKIVLTWPSADGKFSKAKIGGTMIYDTATAPGQVTGTATMTTFRGSASLRHIDPGKTITLTFEFEKTAKTDPNLYDILIEFAQGLTLNI